MFRETGIVTGLRLSVPRPEKVFGDTFVQVYVIKNSIYISRHIEVGWCNKESNTVNAILPWILQCLVNFDMDYSAMYLYNINIRFRNCLKQQIQTKTIYVIETRYSNIFYVV